MQYDVIIIGAGPAGISAGLYSKRANLNVLILYNGISQLEKAHKIDNFYGFENGISGKELYHNGIKQAKNLGINVIEKEVTDIQMIEKGLFEVKSFKDIFYAKSVIIATGNKKLKPDIKGINDFEGKGISYCAICDGFFYRKKNVAVIGNGKFAISEADNLANIVNNIKILTNGLEKIYDFKYDVDTRKIKEIHGKQKVEFIEFFDGDELKVDGIFIAQGIAGGSDFAKKIGIITKNDNIVVNENMETNVQGIYACGNLTGGLLQINKAIYEGAIAGLEASKYVKSINGKNFN